MKLNNSYHEVFVRASGKLYKVVAIVQSIDEVNAYTEEHPNCGLIDSDEAGYHYIAEISPTSI